MIEGERDGEKVSVFKAYPMFTPDEMFSLRGELEKKLTYPGTTPWAAVVDPDGMKALVEIKKGTPKEFRAAYDAEQKKRGAPFPRADWQKIRAAIQASTDAEFAEEWSKAAEAAASARDLGKAAPVPLKEAVEARIASVTAAAKSLLADAKKTKDAKARDAAVAKVLADFKAIALKDDEAK
jgi:hypothetical protein